MYAKATIRGLSQYYVGGLERQEIWINKSSADAIPFEDSRRVSVTLTIGGESYTAGIRTTPKVDYVWICPDLRDEKNQKVSLASILHINGFSKNQHVVLEVKKTGVLFLRTS